MIPFLAILLAVGTPATDSPAAAPTPLPLVDLTDDFAALWDASAALDEADRLVAFKEKFGALLPGFYSAERVGVESAKYDEHVLKGLRAFPSQRKGIEDVSRRFGTMLAPARMNFETAVGPLGEIADIYLINSFGEMDGGTRTLSGTSHLIFGADMIAKLHGEHRIQPFFHHELFHVYHEQRFEGCDAVWCGLWIEGLATAVAATLNPGSTDAELLLTTPEPLRAAYDAHRDEAVCLVRTRLDMPSREAALFQGGKHPSENRPPRIGYYVGYLVAAKAAESWSIKDLAEMKAAQVRSLVESTFAAMADCKG